MDFKSLHHQEKPLLIANVWDVPSAKAAEKLNFRAIGTSSSAIAAVLGYADGEEMSFDELEYMVKRIAKNSSLPLSVDLEAGYSRDPFTIVSNIKRLVALGVVGINLEDSVVEKNRMLVDAEEFAKTLSAVSIALKKEKIELFLNVRTDPFLLKLKDAVHETKKRIALYEAAGANGIFTPFISQSSDIMEIVNSTSLPINVICMPSLPDFDTLTALGVKRISMGNFLFSKMYAQYEQTVQELLERRSFDQIF